MNTGAGEALDYLPLSLVNDFLFCPRRAALKALDGCWGENEHTILGSLGHAHADLPGYEVAAGTTAWRALPVFSDRLGLSGRCDIVERDDDGALRPIEYKQGRRRRFVNDDAQLCAQALCLEEMFAVEVAEGAVFHAATRRRRKVRFTPALRACTIAAVAGLRCLLAKASLPVAVVKAACPECSLYGVCLPEVSSRPAALAVARERLFLP